MTDDERPPDASAAHVARVELVAPALVRVLRQDPRVQRARESWRVAHQLPPADVLLDAATMQRLIFRDKERDLAALDQLVQQELRLDYPWLAQLLLIDFVASVVGEQTGAPPTSLELVADPVDWEPGRRAKDDGQHLDRDVVWYYQREIKRPPDSLRSLGRAYLATLGEARGGDGRSTVEAGIKRAKRFLAALSLEPPLPK